MSNWKFQPIAWAGDTWNVCGVGVKREDGTVFLHLASTTRFRHQRNGRVPAQICDFVPQALLLPVEG